MLNLGFSVKYGRLQIGFLRVLIYIMKEPKILSVYSSPFSRFEGSGLRVEGLLLKRSLLRTLERLGLLFEEDSIRGL